MTDWIYGPGFAVHLSAGIAIFAVHGGSRTVQYGSSPAPAGVLEQLAAVAREVKNGIEIQKRNS